MWWLLIHPHPHPPSHELHEVLVAPSHHSEAQLRGYETSSTSTGSRSLPLMHLFLVHSQRIYSGVSAPSPEDSRSKVPQSDLACVISP